MPIRVVEAQQQADRDAILAFRRGIELGEGREVASPTPDALDGWARHFMALDDGGDIAGTIRINQLSCGDLGTELGERLGLGELLCELDPAAICYSSRLEIAPHKRGHTVVSRLMAAVIRCMLREGLQLDLCSCPLDLVSVYYQLGYRPYLPSFRLPGAGLRQPLVLCPRDREHLREVESPAAHLVPPELDDDGQTAVRLRRIFPEFRDPGFDRISSRALWARLARSGLGAGLPGLGLLDEFQPHELELIAPHVVRQYFLPGQYVYRRGEREPGMGIVLSGSLGVVLAEANDHVLAVLGPSEPFGELQALGPGERSADVQALERSEVLLLPPNFVDRVGRSDPELGFRLARRLLQVLGQRLVAANAELLTMGRSAAHPARARRPGVHAVAPDISEVGPAESFALEDFAALPHQARQLQLRAMAIGAVEIPALLGAGLLDGQRVLDASAEAGLFASALLRRLPGCELVGLQEDERLRSMAEGIAARQGRGDRCRFLDAPPEAIPLPDDSVDFAYARLLLQHRADPAAVLAELKRVTRPGGIVCLLDADDDSILVHPPPPGLGLLLERLARAKRAEGGDRHVGRKLFGMLREAGLEGCFASLLPVTPGAIGVEAFAGIGFGFLPAVLRRGGLWDEQAEQAYEVLSQGLHQPGCFASFAGFLAHGLVP